MLKNYPVDTSVVIYEMKMVNQLGKLKQSSLSFSLHYSLNFHDIYVV